MNLKDRIQNAIQPYDFITQGLLIAVIIVAIWALFQKSVITRAVVAAWFTAP